MPTIQDVARLAGVGVGTVSRVLNDSPKVGDDTRRRVKEVIDELGYRPSSAARALSLGRSTAIAVVAPFFTTASVVKRLQGVSAVLSEADRELVLYDVETPQQRDRHLQRILSNDRAAGLLVFSLAPDTASVERLGSSVPVVFCDRRVEGLPHVWVDDIAAGRSATEHLISLGHTRIGFIGDRYDDAFGFTSSTDRARGYHLALEDAGIESRSEYLAVGAPDQGSARRLTDRLLSLFDPPTAIVAASDMQALGVIEVAAARGLAVPGDLSVVGFDDIEASKFIGLTTVRQPLQESGERAATMLLDAIAGELVDSSVRLDTEVAVRSTTARPQ